MNSERKNDKQFEDLKSDINCDSKPEDFKSDINCDSKPEEFKSDINCDSKPEDLKSDINCDSKSEDFKSDINCDSKPEEFKSDINCDSKSDDFKSEDSKTNHKSEDPKSEINDQPPLFQNNHERKEKLTKQKPFQPQEAVQLCPDTSIYTQNDSIFYKSFNRSDIDAFDEQNDKQKNYFELNQQINKNKDDLENADKTEEGNLENTDETEENYQNNYVAVTAQQSCQKAKICENNFEPEIIERKGTIIYDEQTKKDHTMTERCEIVSIVYDEHAKKDHTMTERCKSMLQTTEEEHAKKNHTMTEKDEQKNTGVKNIIVKYLRSSYKQILAVTYIIFFIILSQIVCFQNQIIFLTPHDSSEKISGNMVQIERKDGTNLVISICENLSNIDLVFFHGRGASNRVHNKITKKLSKYNTISFFWPGYLQNNFLINKKSFKSDLEIFTDYLKKRKSIRNNKIFILGQSFGCNFALFTSKILNVPVILENPFYCLQSTILTSRFFFLSYFLIYNYDNSKYITDIKNKKHVLAILSGKEELFSKSQVKKVKKLLDENKIENIGISEAKHHDVGKFEEFYTAVHNFISSS